MTSVPDYRAIVSGVVAQLHTVFAHSPQGVYVYMDDRHKACNETFARMLGYRSAEEWDQPGAFTEQYVEPQSWHTLVSTYQRAMEAQVAATVDVAWKRKDGLAFASTVILVPIAYDDELLALHFVSPRQP